MLQSPPALAPIQLALPLVPLAPLLPEPDPADQLPPDQIWTSLPLSHQAQIRQRLVALLQEVLHAADRT